MTADVSAISLSGGAPPAAVGLASAAPVPASIGNTVPAGAAAPVWQPWITTHDQAQSALKTTIQAELQEFDQVVKAAQRMLDRAAAAASQQARQLETAAWTSWQKYMDEAGVVSDLLMGPALKAYNEVLDKAHTRLTQRIAAAEMSFNQAQAASAYAKNLSVQSDIV